MEFSPEALAALKELALEKGIFNTSDECLIDSVREHFDVKEKGEIFRISHNYRCHKIEFELKGKIMCFSNYADMIMTTITKV